MTRTGWRDNALTHTSHSDIVGDGNDAQECKLTMPALMSVQHFSFLQKLFEIQVKVLT